MASGDATSNGCLVGETFVDDSESLAEQTAGVIDMDTENNVDKKCSLMSIVNWWR